MDTHLEIKPSKDIGSTWASTSQGRSPGTYPSLMALKRNQPHQYFDLILLVPRTVRNSEMNFCCLSHPVYGSRLQKPQQIIQNTKVFLILLNRALPLSIHSGQIVEKKKNLRTQKNFMFFRNNYFLSMHKRNRGNYVH